MHPALRIGLLALSLFVLAACRANAPVAKPAQTVNLRIATFNASLYTEQAGGLLARLQAGDADARKIAAVVQRVRPDVLLINEFDHDAEGAAADVFMRDYLGVAQNGQEAIAYPYRYLAPVNTGEPSGLDLDRNGRVATQGRERGNDAWGYGLHPGQYGMLVLSRHPIDTDAARSFRMLRWSTLPGALVPQDPATGEAWYPPETWDKLRLSSKSHWDLPIRTPLGTVHLLAAHPTPPVFDGPERRNAARNHDEIRLWAEYLSPGDKPWLCDDRQRCGGLPEGERFVIVGDYNADPVDGSSLPGTIEQLLEHPRVLRFPAPASEGAVLAAGTHAINAGHGAPNAHDTAQFGPRNGNLRVDYVLPSLGFRVTGSGVFWPAPGQPGADWLDATDHHMVWVDLENPDDL